MGVHGSLLRWCESYIRNRSQLVSIHGFKSKTSLVPSGVAQGSHLGPLFFIMYINDLCFSLQTNYKLYADDLKLYKAVISDNDTFQLQEDLNAVYSWCCSNYMALNVDKCHFIRFTKRRSTVLARYSINDHTLTEVASIRDLGITIDSSLSYRNHINDIINKTSKLTGFVTRLMKVFNNPSISILIFNSIIRSVLEYCSPVWSPTYQIHCDRIEQVQKRFLYFLCYKNHKCKQLFTYEARLDHFQMSTLKLRRKMLDMMFLYKVTHGLFDAPDLLESLSFSVPRVGSRLIHRKTFSLPSNRTNVGQHGPLYRMCKSYNAINTAFDMFAGSVVSSKKNLKQILR